MCDDPYHMGFALKLVCTTSKYNVFLPQIRTFHVRSNEQSLRLTSIDHLGTIAARLRSDVMAGSERDGQEHIEILAQALECQDDRKTPSPTETRRMVR